MSIHPGESCIICLIFIYIFFICVVQVPWIIELECIELPWCINVTILLDGVFSIVDLYQFSFDNVEGYFA